jgi:hypothetical protein
MKKVKSIQNKVGGCKNCPPVVNTVNNGKQKINVSSRNEYQYTK